MSGTADAIRDREEAKRPKPEPKKKKERVEKVLEAVAATWTKQAEDAEHAEGQ